MLRKVALITGALALLVAISAPASAAPSSYPNPLPDFAHPADPHNPLLSPASGNDPRPLLVILAVYTDVQDTVTTADAVGRYFAPSLGSVGDYYRAQSFSRFGFTPAAESEGTANDGVIRVSLGSVANIQTAPNGDFGGPFGRQAVLAADPWINFASFDENGDSFVDERELALVVLTQHDNASSCGGTRTINASAVDGVNLANRSYSFDFGLENNITHAHELAHQTLGTADQFYNVGPYDITAVTCTAGQPYFSFNPWHKLHLGWAQPNVVIRDGYYTVPNWTTTGTSFLLYDHERGTDDYVLVENRQRGGYDPDLTGTGLTADSGLIVWRIDDSAFSTAAVELLRASGGTTPNFYGGSLADAFDPSDFRTATRREVAPGWRDGTPSKVAIRAIGSSGPTVRAYFDVRGPGVLVDALRFNPSGALVTRPRVVPGATNPVEIDVMNTGEAADTFRFTLADLPAGWTATTVTRTLAASEKATVTIDVTPPADAAIDTSHNLRATGVSAADTEVISDSPLTLRTSPGVTIADAAPVTEGEDGTRPAEFTVSLTSPPDEQVTVQIATQDGTATQPADYTATAQPVVFAPGQTSRVFAVPVAGDRVDELNETFSARIVSADRAAVRGGVAMTTIVDDDRNGTFSCRAGGARLGSSSQVVANSAAVPCKDEVRDEATVRLTSGLVAVQVNGVRASTDVIPDNQDAAPAPGDRGTSAAETQQMTINMAGIRIGLLGTSATAGATCGSSGAPALSAASEVRGLTVNGQTFTRVTGPLTIPLGLFTLKLNQQVNEPGKVTRQAMVIDPLFGSDIVLSEASAGHVGTPAHPNGHPCTD